MYICIMIPVGLLLRVVSAIYKIYASKSLIYLQPWSALGRCARITDE